MYAAVSPRDQAAGLLCDDGSVKVLDREGVPFRTISRERYLSRHPDTMVVDVRDGKHAVEVLASRATMSMCLDMTLLLFDREVSVQTREELAEELDVLFQDRVNQEYVLDVVLCSPLPSAADVDGAIDAAKDVSNTRNIVTSILDCQERVRLVFESWLTVKQEPIVQQNGDVHVHSLLARHGVFRQLALEATDRAALKGLKPRLAMDATLKNQLDVAPRIVLALVTELGQKLPAGISNQVAGYDHARGEAAQSTTQEYQDASPQHTTTYAAHSAAVSQVERIADLFAQLKDKQARSILGELIQEQRKHPEGEKHLVKSLCNIATRINARGRPEVGLECLLKALEFPNGIDSQLYLQIARGLRDLNQFDEAVKCLDKAETLDRGPLLERILLERIKVRVARGDYEGARADYLSVIPSLEFQPLAFVGLGTLYRRMGRFREAREAYVSCRQIDGDFYSLYAGLAEIRKQMGNPHKAIAEYNELMRRFRDMAVGSKKVYSLARSHLFRLTKQYEKSEELLRELAKGFPGDCDVHLQLAKLLALRGKSDRAREHFEKAKGQSLQDLGQLIFAKASEQFDSTIIQDRLAVIQTSLMPEDKGLASCVEAYDLITNEEFDRAKDVLRGASFVDRYVGDLLNVLRFHALRRTNDTFSYKSDHAMCRVAKQSDHGLRNAMHSIARGEYGKAGELEREFLLRV